MTLKVRFLLERHEETKERATNVRALRALNAFIISVICYLFKNSDVDGERWPRDNLSVGTRRQSHQLATVKSRSLVCGCRTLAIRGFYVRNPLLPQPLVSHLSLANNSSR